MRRIRPTFVLIPILALGYAVVCPAQGLRLGPVLEGGSGISQLILQNNFSAGLGMALDLPRGWAIDATMNAGYSWLLIGYGSYHAFHVGMRTSLSWDLPLRSRGRLVHSFALSPVGIKQVWLPGLAYQLGAAIGVAYRIVDPTRGVRITPVALYFEPLFWVSEPANRILYQGSAEVSVAFPTGRAR